MNDSEKQNESSPVVCVHRLHPELDADIPLPAYMTPHASGLDVCAALEDDLTIDVGAITVVPTGIAMAIPEGYEGQVRPRSGLAFKHGIGIINSPGTIDADYRGEIRIGLINLGSAPYTICRGDRVAQIVIHRVDQARLLLVDQLDTTDRNDGGFGHTGV